MPSTAARPHRPLGVALFLGSDVTSHLLANRLVPILLSGGTRVRLFLTRSKPSKRRPLRLQQLHYVEHELLQDVVYPYIDKYGVPAPGQFNSPAGWRALAPEGLVVDEVDDVNDPGFVESLPGLGIDAAISVRCYQKFRKPILDTLSGPDTVFANLHPGLLPRYRGVNTFLRSMLDGVPDAGFTLHHLDEEFDTGAVIGQAAFPLSYSRSVIENMVVHSADAASLILDLVRRLATHEPVPATVQDSENARYYSYPTDDDLDRLNDAGVDVYHTSAVIDVLTGSCFGTLADVGDLRGTLIDAVRDADIPFQQPHDHRRALTLADA